MQNDGETGELPFVDEPAPRPSPEQAPGARVHHGGRGFPRGKYGKMPGSGRKVGSMNKGPKAAQEYANRASPDAVRHLIKVMQFQRFAINGSWQWPSIHVATMAAIKILDIADMPQKQAALAALGAPVSVVINLSGNSAPAAAAPAAVTIDAAAVRIEPGE